MHQYHVEVLIAQYEHLFPFTNQEGQDAYISTIRMLVKEALGDGRRNDARQLNDLAKRLYVIYDAQNRLNIN